MTLRQALRGCILVATVTAITPRLPAQASPGTDLLRRMHDRYSGTWFRSLTFRQTTTLYRGRAGTPPVQQTWYETLQFMPAGGAVLRIDVDSLSKGNGSLSSADSTWQFAGGRLTAATGSGNPFIPLIENVYLQPVATTVKQLEPLHFDLSRVIDVTWEGRAAWAVGAESASDTTSPQFWVDKERLALVRMLVLLAPNRPPFDIRLDSLMQTGGGWLATRITMLQNGAPRQLEDYFDWKSNVTLDPKLFDVNSWSTARHWVKQP